MDEMNMKNVIDEIVHEVVGNAKHRERLRGLLALEVRDEPSLATDAGLPRLRLIARRMAVATAEANVAPPTPAPVRAKTVEATRPGTGNVSTAPAPVAPAVDPDDVQDRLEAVLSHLSAHLLAMPGDEAEAVRVGMKEECKSSPAFGVDLSLVERIAERYRRVVQSARVNKAGAAEELRGIASHGPRATVSPASELSFARAYRK
jgi:hypothetical protein